MIYWSGDPSFNVIMYFHAVLLFYCLFHYLHCFILQVVMVRINLDEHMHSVQRRALIWWIDFTNSKFYGYSSLNYFTMPVRWVATYCSSSSVNYYHFRHSSQHCLMSPWVDSCPNIVAITLSSLGAHYFLHGKVLGIHQGTVLWLCRWNITLVSIQCEYCVLPNFWFVYIIGVGKGGPQGPGPP